mmetsp:Transcript_13806/g.26496  ORF Transcript_13806/g.26496 Transcript_13806/m.26496 type:complete len:225 (-) Transcript_13806:157-831(-)
MEMPWMAINAATTMITQSRNKEGFECMQRALTQKHVRQMLEDRSGWRRPGGEWLVEEGQSRYMSVAAVFLPEVDEYSWSFLHPYLILSPPGGFIGGNVFAVCAVGALNMGIAVHREALLASDYFQRCELLQRAKLLYMNAEDLLLDEAPELDPDESLFEIFLTVYTNLADIDRELGNIDDVKAWLDDLDDCVDCVAPWDDSSVYRHFRDAARFFRRGMITANAA